MVDFLPLPRPNQSSGFDSKLEHLWSIFLDSLQELGALQDSHFHPGRIQLDEHSFYEPDFLLINPDGQEILAEAKGYHDDRLFKPHQASTLSGLPILVLRPGFIPDSPQANLAEQPGAQWETINSEGTSPDIRYALSLTHGFIPDNGHQDLYIPASEAFASEGRRKALNFPTTIDTIDTTDTTEYF